MSPCFGDFKYEIPLDCQILSYFSLGPKNFAIQFSQNGVLKDIVKLRGVTLSNELNKKIIDSKTYDVYLKSFLKNKSLKKAIPQIRSKICKHTKVKTQKFQKVFFTNSIKSKRIINKKCINLSSFPFGYVEVD